MFFSKQPSPPPPTVNHPSYFDSVKGQGDRRRNRLKRRIYIGRFRCYACTIGFTVMRLSRLKQFGPAASPTSLNTEIRRLNGYGKKRSQNMRSNGRRWWHGSEFANEHRLTVQMRDASSIAAPCDINCRVCLSCTTPMAANGLMGGSLNILVRIPLTKSTTSRGLLCRVYVSS